MMKLPLLTGAFDVSSRRACCITLPSTRARMLARSSAGAQRAAGLLFYVYRKKGPVREFTDDYIRAKLQGMTPQRGVGSAGAADAPGDRARRTRRRDRHRGADRRCWASAQGKIDLQRFFYWHVCKAFYRLDLSFEEMNHVNFDWFAPANAHRQTPEEVRHWCGEAGRRSSG